jgi:hypothetical protein
MPERIATLVLLCLFPLCALALGPGDALPALRIEAPGELRLAGEDIEFAPWDSTRLDGKLHVVQYMAARASSRDINRPFTERLERSGIPLERYHLTTIVNLDDALFGTRGFVMSELEKNKRRYFRSSIVADETGAGRAAWGLQEKSSAILVLDAGGRVLFFRDGAMDAAEVEQVLQMVGGGAAATGH